MAREAKNSVTAETSKVEEPKEEGLVNCLRNERIVVRFVPKTNKKITNPKHILYGGMAESATRTFVVPRLTTGRYVNVLTNSEKAFLEDLMGLEFNALSIYNKKNNFWDNTNDEGISKVVLKKQDNYLDLSDPNDYIKYKILLANKDFIAPSLKALEDTPKATYQFVIVSDNEETKVAKNGMSITMRCYAEYGKMEDDVDTMRTIIELMTNVKTHPSTKKEFLQTKINELIQGNGKRFLQLATDPMLPTKVLIKKCEEAGIIAHRGDQYYIREGNIPMCDSGDPTYNVAAQWLNLPKHQDILISLQGKLKE